MKTIINKAIQENIIQDNLIKDYKVGEISGDREYLTLDELQKLQDLYDKDKLEQKYQNVLRYFLFACYTGLRYGDLYNLKFSSMVDSKVTIKQQKTGGNVVIPLTDKAKRLIPEKKFENQKVFRVLSDQATNRYLKDIMIGVNINKRISTHCARHTFATCGITLGIPIEVVSKILGHTDIKMTQIYSRIIDPLKEQEMKKWDFS